MFRSSLPVGRVLEDMYGLPPVILCYKASGHWLTPERGAPVRIVVPEATTVQKVGPGGNRRGGGYGRSVIRRDDRRAVTISPALSEKWHY